MVPRKGLFWLFLSLGLLVLPALVMFTSVQAEPPPTIPGATYLGSAVCKACHQVQHADFSGTRMGKLFLKNARTSLEKRGCEACHGPSSKHLQNFTDPANNIRFTKTSVQTVAQQNAVCLQCHERGLRLYWKGGPHESRGLACTNCHRVMKKISDRYQFVKRTEMETCFQCHLLRRAQLLRSSHMPYREGKITCSDCHNPHGTATPKQLKANSVNETCYLCHAERRGPFLWEHPPVRESCLNCHEPHGSVNAPLLKLRMPRLCQQCHTPGTQHSTQPNQPRTRFVFNRACLNCHPQIHGSNHPSGVNFQR